MNLLVSDHDPKFCLTSEAIDLVIWVRVNSKGEPSPRRHQHPNDPDNTGQPVEFDILEVFEFNGDRFVSLEGAKFAGARTMYYSGIYTSIEETLQNYFWEDEDVSD